MRHVLEPYYKLFIDGKEVAIDRLEQLKFMARQTGMPYEIYEYRRSVMEAPIISSFSIKAIQQASVMVSKGVSLQIVANKLKISRKYLAKIISKNNLATI